MLHTNVWAGSVTAGWRNVYMRRACCSNTAFCFICVYLWTVDGGISRWKLVLVSCMSLFLSGSVKGSGRWPLSFAPHRHGYKLLFKFLKDFHRFYQWSYTGFHWFCSHFSHAIDFWRISSYTAPYWPTIDGLIKKDHKEFSKLLQFWELLAKPSIIKSLIEVFSINYTLPVKINHLCTGLTSDCSSINF